MLGILLATTLALNPPAPKEHGKPAAEAHGEHAKAVSVSPQASLAELKAGNKRFVSNHRTRSLQTAGDARLRETLSGSQHPFAVIITCSDSRLADNFIFDQELGRLFTIREAGNSPDTQGIASVEYTVEHLGCTLVVVLGHTSCGAVKAVAEAKGERLPGNLWVFQTSMAGLLESTPPKDAEDPKVYQRRLAATNAVRQAEDMPEHSEILREKVEAGALKIVPACYDLATGVVTFLGEPGPKAEH